jgi:hypothetical protein
MKKEIRRMDIEPAENGGHTVIHHYKPVQREGKHGMMPEAYVEPEHHVFGADEGHEMLAHIANHLEIPEMEGDEDEPGTGRKGPREEEGDKDHPGTGVKGPRQYAGDRDENKGEKAERRMTKESAKRVREKVA